MIPLGTEEADAKSHEFSQSPVVWGRPGRRWSSAYLPLVQCSLKDTTQPPPFLLPTVPQRLLAIPCPW